MDLITTLLLEETLDWTNEALFGEITMILSAASGSSVQGLPHFLTHLEEWFAAHPEDRQRALDDPDFLRNASHEALRLFVSTPARIRICTADVTLSTGRHIRAGEKVAVLFLPPNTTSAEFGTAPGTFDLYRKPAESPWGLSFGFGRHACLGRRLVTSSTQHDRDGTMAAVLRRLYESGVRMDPDRPVRIDETSFKKLWVSMPIVFDRL